MRNADRANAHPGLIVSLGFFLIGFFFFIWGNEPLFKVLAIQSISSTAGKVFQATAVYETAMATAAEVTCRRSRCHMRWMEGSIAPIGSVLMIISTWIFASQQLD